MFLSRSLALAGLLAAGPTSPAAGAPTVLCVDRGATELAWSLADIIETMLIRQRLGQV